LRARARDALIVAIVRVVGSRCFTASEVIAHAPLDPGLASALRAAGATNAVRLGKRLKGVAGQAVACASSTLAMSARARYGSFASPPNRRVFSNDTQIASLTIPDSSVVYC
jgi:hypothetical protein